MAYNEDSSGSGHDEPWIQWFCGLKGHEMFCEVERAYIEDGFNLYGLRASVPNFSDCLDLILDRIGPDDSDDSHLTQSACTLYGLIHARYIITAHGLDAMYNKYAAKEFGTCPLVQCLGQPVLPVGLKDEVGADTVKVFCPKCQCVYHPPPSRSRGGSGAVDGASFGTTFPHLFLMTFSNLVPDGLPPDAVYVPRVFGFRVHQSARQQQQQQQGAMLAAVGNNTRSGNSRSYNNNAVAAAAAAKEPVPPQAVDDGSRSKEGGDDDKAKSKDATRSTNDDLAGSDQDDKTAKRSAATSFPQQRQTTTTGQQQQPPMEDADPEKSTTHQSRSTGKNTIDVIKNSGDDAQCVKTNNDDDNASLKNTMMQQQPQANKRKLKNNAVVVGGTVSPTQVESNENGNGDKSNKPKRQKRPSNGVT